MGRCEKWFTISKYRSIVEISCGVGVAYGTYSLYGNKLHAVLMGVSSMVMVMSANDVLDRFVKVRHDMEQSKDTVYTALFFAMMLGAVVFNFIYTHLTHVGVAAVVASSVGFLFSLGLEWMLEWKMTVLASRILQDRVWNTKRNWIEFPMRSGFEFGCWIGVFMGTLAISYNMVLASLFGTMAGIVVTLGGEVFHRSVHRAAVRFMVHEAVQDETPSMLVLFISGYGGAVAIYVIYHHIESVEMALCLASLSGIIFLSASECLLIWTPTRKAGLILQNRIVAAKVNWQNRPIRSFVELGCWLGMTYGTYAVTKNLAMALQWGSFVAIAVTLIGESCIKPQYAQTEPAPPRTKYLPFIVLLGYAGTGTFTWIFDHMRSIEVAIILAIVAGVVFLGIADLLVLWKPTRESGIILQERFLKIRHNWSYHPLRSFIELGVWLGVTYGTYAVYRNFTVAVQLGTMSGMMVTLVGEGLRTILRQHLKISQDTPQDEYFGKDYPGQVLPLPLMCLFGIFGAMAFDTIYTHLRRIELAFVLATITGILFLVAGDLFVFWRPTRVVGLILQQRIVGIRYNLQHHFGRTATEIASLFVPLLLTLHFNGNPMVALPIATTALISVCLLAEVIVTNMQCMEDSLKQDLAKPRRYSMQSQATLIDLPYELLLHIGSNLDPADLLVVRASCRRVNDMLRAESSRYWMHVGLRKKLQGNTLSKLNRVLPVRSLVIESLRILKPMFLARSDPSTLLEQDLRDSRVLRWVYFNASWIRKQKLLVRSDDPVHLFPSDNGYSVFRHIPDTQSLCIHNRKHHLSVPNAVYSKFQRDPLHFVAAKSLHDVALLSNWHLIAVFVATMFIVFALRSVRELCFF